MIHKLQKLVIMNKNNRLYKKYVNNCLNIYVHRSLNTYLILNCFNAEIL